MQNDGQSGIRIVERDGRLVVEQAAEKGPRAPRLPRIRLPRLPFSALGMWLFTHRFAYERLDDNYATLSAEDLKDYVELDARSYDRYYVTPRQQALLGVVSIGKLLGLALGVFVVFFGQLFDIFNGWSVPLLTLLGLLASGLFAMAHRPLLEIQGQLMDPEA